MTYRQQWSKYGAKKTVVDGIQYHSKKEAGYGEELRLRLMGKDIKAWWRQIRLPLDVNGYHITNYFIDFVIEHTNGDIEFVEIKGYETAEWRIKWKLFEAIMSDERTCHELIDNLEYPWQGREYKLTVIK